MPVLRVAAFPGAHLAPLYHALAHGAFSGVGLDVRLWEVTSSAEQLAAWDRGELDVVHTAVDHFVRGERPVAGKLLWREPVGELVVYAHSDVASRDPESIRWAVDAPDSGFAFVLRAVVEDILRLPAPESALVAVGGTRERLAALLDGAVAGATLHNPFDAVAGDAGIPRVGGHLDVAPDLLTSAAFARSAIADAKLAVQYASVLRASSSDLLERGPDHARSLLLERGLGSGRGPVAGQGLFGPLGLGADQTPSLDGVLAVAALRQRFVPGWSPDIERLRALLPAS